MRTKEMIQRDLDAVARTFPEARGSMLTGKLSLETVMSRPIPLPVKRFDFLANGEELSKGEQDYSRFYSKTIGG